MTPRVHAAAARAAGRRLAVVATVLALGAVGRPAAAADGAWRTYIRAVDFTDLAARGGEIWGATSQGGLLRFDRVSGGFEVIRREPGSIASNRLGRLAFDGSGRLWVGSLGQGASRRSADGRSWSLVNVIDGLPSDSVTALEPQADTLWIGTRRGIALWNGREVAGALPDGITTSFDTTFTLAAITGVAAMGDSLFLSTPRGAGWARISQVLSDWRPVNQGLTTLDVRSLASDGTDLFALAGVDLHRFRFDLGSWEPAGLAGPVFQLADQGGRVLAATAGGVFVWRTIPLPGWSQVGDPLLPGAPGTGPVLASDPLNGGIIAARAETLYVQALPVPVPVVTRTAFIPPWISIPAPDGPTHNDLVSVVVEGARVYATTFFKGMGRFDGSAWFHWRDACTGPCDTTLVRANTAFGLMVDREGHKWVGGWSSPPFPGNFAPGGALTEIDDSVSPPVFTHRVRVNDISELELQQRSWMLLGVADARGRRWFATDTPAAGDVDPIGLVHYDSAGAFVEAFNPGNSDLSGLFIHGMGTTRNGRIWLGLDGQGLDYFTPPATATGFEHIASTSGSSIRGLATYGDSVWILATDQNQLQRFDQGANPVSTAESRVPLLCPQTFLGVQPLATGPDGRVWVATTVGLKTLGFGGGVDSFTTLNSPLPDDEVRSVAVEPATGAVWITTASGLARFDPGYVPPPPPRLDRLRVRVYPNPATLTALGIALRLTGEGETYRGTIHDLAGRRLRSFSGLANGAMVWDGRDAHGRLVKPGIYFVRAEAGGRASVARVVLFH